ncbi:hypothetical protein A7B04_25205, partial [Salmonella enterica subsp. enterica]
FWRQRQNLVFRVRAIAKIINHDGELASKNGMCKRQQSGQREKGATKLRQNLSSQPRLWIDALPLATNFEIKRGSPLTAATAHK